MPNATIDATRARAVRAALQERQAEMTALRRDLHRIPEVGLDLPDTQARLLTELDGLPLDVTLGTALTSITAVLRGTHPGRPREGAPVVLLRADMDALPVQEESGEPFAADNGAMHGCGHDLHMTMLVAAARELCARRGDLAGDIVFMFQPGEEGHDGAALMIDEGVLEAAGRRPDVAYALHVWSALEPFGTFCLKAGTVMSASDQLDVVVRGRGGHGSAPHQAKDPVPAACEMVLALQVAIARGVDVADPAVITVGHLHAGSARNVIPETAEFAATIRTFSTATQAILNERIPAVLNGIAAAHQVTAEIDLRPQYPATVNDEDHTALVDEAVQALVGEEHLARWRTSLTASEDFSRVLEQVPGCFIGLAAVPPGTDPAAAPFNHSAYAVFDDGVLADGAALFVELALAHLVAPTG